MAHLSGTVPGGLNGSYVLKSGGVDATVGDDGAKDMLTGSAGADWFFANLVDGVLDKITDLKADEFAGGRRSVSRYG